MVDDEYRTPKDRDEQDSPMLLIMLVYAWLLLIGVAWKHDHTTNTRTMPEAVLAVRG